MSRMKCEVGSVKDEEITGWCWVDFYLLTSTF